ncbi:MAG: DUF3782 domain-containing protein [Verrucomicrobia bacterium]|nr:DUF3782 domain-containing protein [Verrucomicrobiota bacterium]
MTDEELKQLVSDTATAVQRLSGEHAKTEAVQRRTEDTLREVTKQLGGLGNKFGSFTEGLAFASMRRVLTRHFHADEISFRRIVRRNGHEQEFDLIGIANGERQAVYVVEIKSELNEQELQKSLRKLRAFFDYFPIYRGLKLYGIISAVDVRGALADRVLHEGLYLATASDENFKLVKPPRGFKPKVFTSK